MKKDLTPTLPKKKGCVIAISTNLKPPSKLCYRDVDGKWKYLGTRYVVDTTGITSWRPASLGLVTR